MAILMLAGSGRAPAAEYRGTDEQRQACTSDVFRLCSAHIPDVGSIVTCMKARRSQLSPGCRAAFVGGSTRTARHTQHDGAERRHTGNHVAHQNERRQNKREAAR